MENIWDRKSFEVEGHWPFWWGWKNRITTRKRQKLNANKQKLIDLHWKTYKTSVNLTMNQIIKLCRWKVLLLIYHCTGLPIVCIKFRLFFYCPSKTVAFLWISINIYCQYCSCFQYIDNAPMYTYLCRASAVLLMFPMPPTCHSWQEAAAWGFWKSPLSMLRSLIQSQTPTTWHQQHR